MQILVVVASIQIRTLKTEAEKGFMRTVFGHELVGPKTQSNFVLKGSGVVVRLH